jgi:hypothetical protein
LQKHIIKWSFWLGVLALVLALASRAIDLVNPDIDVIPTKGDSIGFNAFMHGAFRFFAATVAATCYAWFTAHQSFLEATQRETGNRNPSTTKVDLNESEAQTALR